MAQKKKTEEERDEKAKNNLKKIQEWKITAQIADTAAAHESRARNKKLLNGEEILSLRRGKQQQMNRPNIHFFLTISIRRGARSSPTAVNVDFCCMAQNLWGEMKTFSIRVVNIALNNFSIFLVHVLHHQPVAFASHMFAVAARC